MEAHAALGKAAGCWARASELLVPPQACDEGARQVGTGHFGVRVGVLLQGTAEAAGAGRAPRDT